MNLPADFRLGLYFFGTCRITLKLETADGTHTSLQLLPTKKRFNQPAGKASNITDIVVEGTRSTHWSDPE